MTSALRALHDRLGICLALLVPLTAVPLASNRAALWLIWTAVLSVLALLVLRRSLQQDPGWTPRIAQFRLPLLLACLVPVWALIQLLPLTADGTGRLSGRISVQPDGAAAGILRLAGYLLLAALLLEVATQRDRVRRMGTLLFAGLVAQAIYALVALQLLGDAAPWGAKTAYAGSATGTFVNRNALATHLGLGLVLGLGLLAERAGQGAIRNPRGPAATGWPRPGDLFLVAGLGFLFVALVATQSRLGLAASLAAVVTVVVLIRRRGGASARRLMAEAGALCLALGGAVLVLGAGGVAERLLFTAPDGDSRLALYRQTLAMIAERPLTGWGMDAFGTAFERFRAPPLLDPVAYDLAHNTYLALWAEFGLIFGTAPVAALALLGGVLWRRLRDTGGGAGLAAAGLGALVLGALHSLGDFGLEMPANAYLLIAILALGLGQGAAQRARHPGHAAIAGETGGRRGAAPC